MEFQFSHEDGLLLEELLALRRDCTWDSSCVPPTQMNQSVSCGSDWGYSDCFEFGDHQNPAAIFPNSVFSEPAPLPIQQQELIPSDAFYCAAAFGDEFLSAAPRLTAATTDSSSINTLDSYTHTPPPSVPIQEDTPCEEPSNDTHLLAAADDDYFQNLEMLQSCFKVEPVIACDDNYESEVLNVGANNNGSSRIKKLGGQPSKNLMAERRRRKRLNDRLSMLRSIVPKISKMDRTSILADTIDYMRELLDKISNLKLEIEATADSKHLETGIFNDMNNPNQTAIRNSPKFDVKRRDMDTQIEICCAGKPGLLLSTVTSLEALGLEIEHCVISCFNDFSMQASCSHEVMEEQRAMLSSEDIKQALFRNAGYGGKCL